MTVLELGARTDSGPASYRFRTREGLYAEDSFRTGELLALEACWDRSPASVLVVEANYGVVGTVLAERAAVTMTESSARAAACCRRNCRDNGVAATVRLAPGPGALDERFDAAVYVPRPYTPVAVGKQRLVDALERLVPGGDLSVAGRDRTGLGRYRDCLGSVTAVSERDERDGTTLLRARRPDGFDPPTVVEPTTRHATVDGVSLDLVTEPGLFAAGGLDDGTRLLLETTNLQGSERVLDLCCGYGPVGAYAALAGADVTLTDDDARATRCARRTLAANGVSGTVRTADCVDGLDGRAFDVVLANPPTHAGEGVLAELFRGAGDVLAPDGRFLFVHHRRLDLSEYCSPFGTVEEVAAGPEHVVTRAAGTQPSAPSRRSSYVSTNESRQEPQQK